MRLPRARPGAAAVQVPGDKSISHRALILSAMLPEPTSIAGLNRGADVRATVAALRSLGATIHLPATANKAATVRGVAQLRDPGRALDCGNSGSTMRLLMGFAAGRVNAVLDGDASLRRRPMARVAIPLRLMGAEIELRAGEYAPVTMHRSPDGLEGVDYRLPVASAQLKSALLVAGLRAHGITRVSSPEPTRDHTERMLRLMHASVAIGPRARGRTSVVCTVRPSRLRGPKRINVPGDFSSAFYLLAAAAALPAGSLRLVGVGINPTRTAALAVARDMGVDIRIHNRRAQSGEPVGDLVVRGGAVLRAVDVRRSLVPLLIDEIPAICALAAIARGTSRIEGAAELRRKESDRIATTVELVRSFGAQARPRADGMTVTGTASLRSPATADTHGDHRIGLAAAILAAAVGAPLEIANAECIATSFPGFLRTWRAAFGSSRGSPRP
ncbi:MAG: 3-phosphoshikimate 1-carboxyvinyltransferase [Candidatus Eremiobacter antarcticus]|nr:3-phosphoshikimate 1-carboxyvinyltransferase [Candidatus Eremiobacteraeota bacterium]MBC5807250.1 3-phosphoshikimate 1-carboxyvinyltransferase [Candidatus Eremiobacteraeota bacterium]PZR61941.1 MAG: 3-phosphoshikimate 1-carboxyvinyltransferase [Candidatus Eremiobacter sp. RRmetagenome_bin22]